MKKLFMFLAVAGLATFGASCGSDDSKSEGGDDGKLSLTASKTSVEVDEAVTFTVKLDGKAETGAELYIGSTKIASPYTFKEEGVFEVVAKKKGATDSPAVKITVAKKGEGKKTLVLSASKSAVNVGEEVKFTVKDDKGAVVEGAKIKQVGGADLAGDTWTATAAGTVKFVASKDNYDGSNEVSVTVTAPPALVIALVTNPQDVYAGEPFVVSIKNAAGEPVVGAELYLNGNATGILSEEGKYSLTPNIAGDYDLQAKKGQDVSNDLLVVVQAARVPETSIEGTFVYKGTTYNVNEGVLVLDGIYYMNEERTEVATIWNLILGSEQGVATFLEFATPATPSGSSFSPVRPNATNTTTFSLAVVDLASQQALDQTQTGITLKFEAVANANGTVFTGPVKAGAAALGGQVFTANVNGDLLFSRSESAAIRANGQALISSNKTLKVKGVKSKSGLKSYKVAR